MIDDTYNANPAGARSALALLATLGTGKKVVVTPGMVELGAVQARENANFAASAGEVATDLLVVGRTNARVFDCRGSCGKPAREASAQQAGRCCVGFGPAWGGRRRAV